MTGELRRGWHDTSASYATMHTLVYFCVLLGWPRHAHSMMERNREFVESLERFLFSNSGVKAKDIQLELDVGAHAGDLARDLRENLLVNAEFFLIEGSNDHIESLSRTGFPFITALISDADGESVNFYKANSVTSPAGSDLGNSIFLEQTEFFEKATVEERRTVTIDTLLEKEGVADLAFDLIKLDLQGAELKALRGAIKTIHRGSPLIITEVSIIPYNGNEAPLFYEIHKFMENQGFRMVDIIESHYARFNDDPNKKILTQLDIVWKKRHQVCWSAGGSRSEVCWGNATTQTQTQTLTEE